MIDRGRVFRRHFWRTWYRYGLFWLAAVLVGLTAILYSWLINWGYGLFLKILAYGSWLPLIITPLVAVAGVWLTRRLCPGSEGSGIPQVIATLENPSHRLGQQLLTLRIAVGKMALSFLAILGGFTIGREGPTVQVGAAIMYNLRSLYPRSNVNLDQQLTLAGAAAGLSAAFNTPLAGIMFAIEELMHSFSTRASGAVIIAITIAGVVSLGVNGNYLYFDILNLDGSSNTLLMLPAILATALVTGVAGGIFVWLALNSARWLPAAVQRLRLRHPLKFAALCGLAIALVGLASANSTYGTGYDQVQHLVNEQGPQPPWYYPFVKMLALLLSYLPGVPGGIFAPSLSIGAGLAQLLHALFGALPLPNLIALAMTGYLAAATRAPITSFVIVMEMADGHEVVIAMMATALMASRISAFFAPPFYAVSARRYYPQPVSTPVSG